MIKTDAALNQAEIAILKIFENHQLISYEMKCVGGNDAWSTVRLHFENGDIDVISSIQIIPEDKNGSADEFSVLRVANVSPGKPIVPEMPGETSIRPVGKTMTSLSIANDTICYYSGNTQDSEITYTQAILLDFENDCLCIDKETWFSEILFVKGGFNKEELVHDDSLSLQIDPEEDPISHMTYSSKIIPL
jgi:hypothetical protein